jgi:hypothetical protein
MEEGVLHHGTCLFGDGANGAFGDSVLVMSTNTGKLEFLIAVCE